MYHFLVWWHQYLFILLFDKKTSQGVSKYKHFSFENIYYAMRLISFSMITHKNSVDGKCILQFHSFSRNYINWIDCAMPFIVFAFIFWYSIVINAVECKSKSKFYIGKFLLFLLASLKKVYLVLFAVRNQQNIFLCIFYIFIFNGCVH